MDKYKLSRFLVTMYIMIIMALIAIIMSGCYTKKAAISKFGCTTIKDSIHTDTTSKDTSKIIFVPGDTVKIIVQSPCDSLGKLKPLKKEIKGKNGRLSGIIFSDTIKNTIEADCFEAELRDTINWQTQIISKYREKIIKDNFIEKPSFWVKLKDELQSFGIHLLIILFLYLMYVIIKKLK